MPEASAVAAMAASQHDSGPLGDTTWRHDEHVRCGAVSNLLRGTLCQQVALRPARRVARDRFLYLIGDPATSIYLLKSGLVKTSCISTAGDETILQLHQPGELFGESCFCTRKRREQAMTLESSEVVEIRLEELLEQLQRNSQAALDLVTALCERLGALSSRLQSLSFEPTPVRLVRTLLLLADTLGNAAPDGTRIVPYVRQEELAQMIAARREVVSGLLNILRADGLIDYSRKRNISVRRDALQRRLDSLTADTGK